MIRQFVALALPALLISACANQALVDKKNAETAQAADAATAHETRAPIRPNHVVFLGKTHIDSEHGDLVPERFEGSQGFVWSPAQGDRFTLAQVAARITKFTGLGVNIEEGAAPPAAGAAATPAASTSGSAHAGASDAEVQRDPSIETINDLIRDTPASPGGSKPSLLQGEHIEPYAGPLSGFLGMAATLYGRDWELHGRIVYFPKYLTRIYQVDDLNSDTTTSAGLTGLGSSSGSTTGSSGSTTSGPSSTGGSSSGQNANTTTSIKPWDELIKTVQMFAGEKNVIPAPASHEISVRCPRLCQEQVKQYIRDHNREVSRTIHLVVAIRAISDTGQDEYGFNPTLAYQNAGFTLALNPQASQLSSSPTPGSIVTSILNPPAGSTASHYSGSSLSLQALSQLEKQTTGITKEAYVGNNRPFALRNALDFSYVGQSSTSTSSALATSTSSLTTVIIGDQLQILPHLTNDGHIRLSLALSQTAQDGPLQTADLGNGATTQFPQITDNATAPVEFTMRDGQTIILTDVSSRTSSDAQSGSCGVACWLLGGSVNANNTTTRTILIITAEETHPGDEDASAIGVRAQ